jgi:hypothetical protein
MKLTNTKVIHAVKDAKKHWEGIKEKKKTTCPSCEINNKSIDETILLDDDDGNKVTGENR